MYECDDKMVSHPSHYQGKNGLEVINVIEAFTADLNGIEATDTGNVLKYMCRWKAKNGLQDLKKAQWYLTDLIDRVEKSESKTAENNRKEDKFPEDIQIEMLFERERVAHEILQQLKNHIEMFGTVSVLDYFDLLGKSDSLMTPMMFEKYGWINLDSAIVLPTKTGNFFTITLPAPIKL